MRQLIVKITLLLAMLVTFGEPPVATGAEAPQRKQTQTTRNKRSNSRQTKSKNQSSKSKTNTARKRSQSAKPETSEDVRRKHEAAQKDIKLTEEQIRQNEAKIKKSLSDLNRINSEIAVTRTKVSDMATQLNKLNSQISSLETQISANEKALEKLRSEYLKAVKKMRVSKRNQSTLAFIFASENFNQALRRMRYLKQFSEWKDKQSAEINKKVDELKRQTALLEQTRADKDRVYTKQLAAQKTLETQGRQQDALVGELRKNGEALKTHLSKKQAEANALRNRIASLIAAEEQKAAEQRAARERAEAERVAKEKAAAEAQAKAEAERQAKAEAEKKQQAAAVDQQKADKKKEKPKTEKKKEEKPKKQTSTSKDYAEARNRKPRGVNNKAGSSGGTTTGSNASKGSSTSAGSASSSGNFGAMRGSLPRPVDGSWRITSRFGRQSLPDLPDVVYDNPGIDAEVANGATAKAVYGGNVSGVYMIPGFGTVVIVNHGDYFTVYGNLASSSVKPGDNVKQGQAVGKVGASQDDPARSSIHFEVWKHRDKLNPQDWVR